MSEYQCILSTVAVMTLLLIFICTLDILAALKVIIEIIKDKKPLKENEGIEIDFANGDRYRIIEKGKQDE